MCPKILIAGRQAYSTIILTWSGTPSVRAHRGTKRVYSVRELSSGKSAHQGLDQSNRKHHATIDSSPVLFTSNAAGYDDRPGAKYPLTVSRRRDWLWALRLPCSSLGCPCQSVFCRTTVHRPTAAEKDNVRKQVPHLWPGLMNRHYNSYLRSHRNNGAVVLPCTRGTCHKLFQTSASIANSRIKAP